MEQIFTKKILIFVNVEQKQFFNIAYADRAKYCLQNCADFFLQILMKNWSKSFLGQGV